MSLFSNIRKATNAVTSTSDALKTASQAFGAFGGNSNPHPYQSMMGNPTSSRGAEGYLSNYQNQQSQEEEDEEELYHPVQVEREVTEALMDSFRKRATMKTDMIILKLQKNYLYQKVLAKIIIQSKGDDVIAKTHEDKEDDELAELPKEVQKIIRNQKHLQAIESVSIDDYFKDSCIEYFMMEFEEDYRNGLTPDFKGINPIELLTMKMQEPFLKLIADYTVDIALDMKPNIVKGALAMKRKYIDKPINKVTEPNNTTEVLPTQAMPEETSTYTNPLLDDWNDPANDHWDKFNPQVQTEKKDINDEWSEMELKRQQKLEETKAEKFEEEKSEFQQDEEGNQHDSEQE